VQFVMLIHVHESSENFFPVNKPTGLSQKFPVPRWA